MKEILLLLIGATFSAFGGYLAAWYRAKVAGKVKLQETIGERKLAAYGKGLELIDQLQSVLVKGNDEDALAFLTANGDWFAGNLILLPHAFVQNWRSIRLNLSKVIMYGNAQEKAKGHQMREKMVDHAVDAYDFCNELAKEAENSIRQELGLPEFVIRHPPKAKPIK